MSNLDQIVERAMQPFSLLALAPQVRQAITRACEQWEKLVIPEATWALQQRIIKREEVIHQLRQQLEESQNCHPKASQDTDPGEGAAKQPGKAPSALCEVGTCGDEPQTTSEARPHIAPAQLIEIVERAVGELPMKSYPYSNITEATEIITRACEEWGNVLLGSLKEQHEAEDYEYEKQLQMRELELEQLRQELKGGDEPCREKSAKETLSRVSNAEPTFKPEGSALNEIAKLETENQQLRQRLKDARACENGLREQILRYQEVKGRR